ncbi:MAG TPA: SCO family protein [Acidimicrobiales bacterium]|nr:SCO family protein [Acidimicrobiales bacterium]
MPGMGTYLQTRNPVVVSAFHSALLHQFEIVLAVVAVLSLVFNVLRTSQYRRALSAGTIEAAPGGRAWGAGPEPAARRLLRIGSGLLWIGDGLLQLQPGMPLGMAPGVLSPSAASSPGWVQHLVNVGVGIWSRHPVQAAAATVWIQVGIGALLLLAPRPRWSRLAGVAALAWGLVVWSFGEAFGGVFGHGASFLFGTPGAALFYCAAGALLALPESRWAGDRLGRTVLRLLGVLWVGAAVLQAWPGRGSWQGAPHGAPSGSLAAMVDQMAQTSQPGVVASWVRAFGRFDAAHGWGVNLVVVAALAAVGAACWSRDRRVLRAGAVGAVVLCLADWVLVQDMGFFGGLGTDPNSMIPLALLVVAGYVAVVRAAAPVVAPVVARPPDPAPVAGAGAGRSGHDGEAGPRRRRWDDLTPGALSRALLAVAAVGVVLIGAVPMAAAGADPHADPILATAADGTPDVVDTPAPGFRLEDQRGRPVSLAGLRGRTVALTFLDPVCTSDCPVIAQEFKQADGLLGADARRVVMVAIVVNPIYRSLAFTNAFDRQEGLDHLANWLYLTGSVSALERVWDAYGVEADVTPAGAMVDHSDLAYVIDARGHTREVLSADPGDGAADASSFAVYLTDAVDTVLHR